MIKAAIIGCGKIADAHAAQIRRIEHGEIVGVCDHEELMARQLSERFNVGRYFSDLDEMLSETRPDVVHITTPPLSHFDIARHCLERGCHVYVEKPFTLTAADAESLTELADQKGLKVTAGHDDQFSHVARRLRQTVRDGYLGGGAIHMESHFGYDLGDPSYAKALLGDKNHWVRKLPGKLLHNIISHGIARIAEFLDGDEATVIAHGFVSPMLQGIGETEIVDELRVIISGNRGATAYFTFSSGMRPSLHQFRIYGPQNGLLLDEDHQVLIRLRGARFKSYAEKFVPPMIFAKEYVANSMRSMRTFLGRDFHMKSGMKYLTESFYHSISTDGPPPIPYREIRLIARIMDDIFDQIPSNCAS